MLRVDAHHHLWRYNNVEYDWLNGALTPLRRDFLPKDLLIELQIAQVAGAVAVQARQSIAETEELLQLAEAISEMLGVVGWLPLRSPDFPALLERHRESEFLKGLRHVLQAEPTGFMDGPSFLPGIGELAGTGLVYDILIVEAQLDEALRLVDRFPGQSFVLDHLAKPRIADGELRPWARRLRELARRPNVTCKVSGMVTEADPHRWSADQLKPYFEIALEAFTPSRLMAGTDWPVLIAGCSYGRWWNLLSSWVSTLSKDEQADVLGLTAVRTYGLEVHRVISSQTNGGSV
jgi:L-fuconolactonase